MDLLKPPEPLRLSGNLSENWKRFKQRFELFLQATAVEKAPRSDSSKVALLLSFAGDEVLDIFNNFQYGPEESKECYDTVVQKFDAYFSEYIPGKHLVLADMLSRSTADNQDEAGATTDVEVHAIQLLGYRVTEATQKELQAATARDRYLQSVIASLSVGLPVQGELKPFEQELSFVNGILLKASKVVIPKSMRQTMLEKIHAGHLACQERARRLVFWPGLNAEIASMVQLCPTCRKYAYKQPKEPLQMRPVPGCAWHRVGADIFSFAGDSYIVVFDALSNFPEVQKLSDMSAQSTIAALSAIFARFGVPVEVCTDNGPQFSSHEFLLFSRRYDFTHVTSSPHYPQSNGLAEKGVQVVKRILKKTADSGDDFWLGLLAYRSTPLEDGRSPGELLQGRRLRANLPDFSAVTATDVKKHSQAQGGRPLPPLQKGVVVRLRDAAWSRKAQVVGSPYPRSYLVKTEDQKLLRRNRRHLLQTGERFIEESDDDIDSSPADNNVGGHPTVATSTSPANGRRREVPTSGDPSAPVVRQSTSLPTPALRRSTLTVKPPQRLHYDKDFNQVSDTIF
ncbi:uncharacterized protein K02A2.6-like isoform X1 [Rhipicephalus sanguineus]|uniref:uncharacterized protein K02A2.6-like isoform X1 n=1 Tax=Rhipicephalus sanguineus TaxID=34632 RepID=UPI0020C1DC0B|nr:uncharacterized protein K02A2.6-like isoform X1 [Rhipicephalus sanguineus]